MKMLKNKREEEAGQALIEMVVSVPLLLLILIGAFEFARATYAAIEISNSARAAVQYAAMNGGFAADTGGVQNAAQIDSPNLVSAVTANVTSDSCACSGSESSGFSCSNPPNNPVCPAGQHVMETVTVTTQATYIPLMRWGGTIPSSLTLNGYAQQMVLK
jgi:Flp pilus assembly protein TadG